ncbi:MAG: MBL fold metallo-hydrolase [Mycobacterium sp.]|nr:MBL fold metallo-hydrolase [Mycobacterium sp.]
MADVTVTHIGGPTALIAVDGWRLLTDPTFDPAGERWNFGWGAMSQKLTGPAVSAKDLPPIDAVLLSHDQHGDNLDHAGRALLARAGTVITTTPGAKRLCDNAIGLSPWQTTTLSAPGRPAIEITATPARHGPPGSRPIVGSVVGFALAWSGQTDGALWISGDTVLFDGIRQVAERLDVSAALIHLGGVRFPMSGPLRYTMNAQEAVDACRLLNPRTVIPLHYEGWKHFRQSPAEARQVFASSPFSGSTRWLEPGVPTTISV